MKVPGRVAAVLVVAVAALWLAGPGVPRAASRIRLAQAAPGCVPPQKLGVVFVIDDSGSMIDSFDVTNPDGTTTTVPASDPAGLRWDATQAGLDRLADGYVAAAVTFSDGAVEAFGPTGLDPRSRPAAKARVATGSSFGGTNFEAAFAQANAELAAMPAGVDRTAVVFLSDGRPTSTFSSDEAIAARGTPIYTVGLGPGVDATLMTTIAQRTGGQYFKLDSASDIMPIFGSIVSALTCDQPLAVGGGPLNPGQRRSFPFHVGPDDESVQGFVSWGSGQVAIHLVRPGGSISRPGRTRAGESFTLSDTYDSFALRDPRRGNWQLVVTAISQTGPLQVNVQVFRRTATPARGLPTPNPDPSCGHDLRLGPVHVVASCLTHKGNVYRLEANGQARVNGIDLLTPDSGASLEFDTKELEVHAHGKVQVQAGPRLRENSFDWKVAHPIEIKLDDDVALKGMPLQGSVRVGFIRDGASLTAHASIGPEFGNITGDIGLHATTGEGVKLDNLRMALSDSDLKLLGRLVIKAAAIDYTAAENLWRGNVALGLPASREVAASLGVANAHFHDASVDATGLNLPIGEVVFLKSLGASVAVAPLHIGGSTAFTAGPSLRVFGRDLSALEGDARLDWTQGPPFDTYALAGNLKLASFDLADASVTYRSGVDLSMAGNVGVNVFVLSFNGHVEGWIEGVHKFQVTGNGQAGVKFVKAGGKGLFSTRGVAVCGDAGLFDIGGWYRWGDAIAHMGGCDFSRVEEGRSVPLASASQAAGQQLTLRASRQTQLIAVHGAGAAPHLQVLGPGGFALTADQDGQAYMADGGYLIESPGEQTTFVYLAHPLAGVYQFIALAGSPPPTSARRVRRLPAIFVRARVRGHRLRWRLRRIRGQRVLFVERGAGVAHVITTTRRGRGSVRFTPAAGVRERRTIQAVVLQDGIARDVRDVAHYRFRPGRPARATHVRARRHGRRVRVSWRHRGAVAEIDVTARVSDGRKLLHVLTGRARRTTFRTIGNHTTTFTVVALGADGRRSRPARVTIHRR